MPLTVVFMTKRKIVKVNLKLSKPSNYLDIKIILKDLTINKDKELYIDISNVPEHNKFGAVSRIIQGLFFMDEMKTIKINKTIVFVDKTKNKNMEHKVKILIDLLHLTNQPSNIIIPSTFCEYAQDFLKEMPNVNINIFNHESIKTTGLNLISAMGSGSKNEPYFMVINVNPSRKQPVCLVGKGVTFDSGGMDLKPSAYGMNLDKTGACIVLAIAKYMAQHSKTHCVILIPLIENNLNNNALKPGDVVKSYNKSTVEIVDTDAEGRIILADSLAYLCANYKPAIIIDVATLTGWSERLSCDSSYVYFTTNDSIADNISRHSDNVFEKSIRFPLWTEYITYTKSAIADYKNFGFGCKNTDGMMAALFMMNFIPEEYRNKWVHFDVKTKSINSEYGTADSFLTLLDYLSNHHL